MTGSDAPILQKTTIWELIPAAEAGEYRMKRKIIFFLTVACILAAVCTISSANTYSSQIIDLESIKNKCNVLCLHEQNKENVVSNSELPSSLTIISDEAFEGTALTSVELPQSVTVIGDYAFANNPFLIRISIPNAIKQIGENAFLDSPNIIIAGPPKGYARAYAEENGIPFSPITSIYASGIDLQIINISNGSLSENGTYVEIFEEYRHQIPTGRMTGELNADRYEAISAFHIQGRSPPAS